MHREEIAPDRRAPELETYPKRAHLPIDKGASPAEFELVSHRFPLVPRRPRLAVIPATVLALFASLAYGSSDFAAGLVSRQVSSVAVALWSQLAGAATLSLALVASGQRPDASGVIWGVAAGVTVAVGILSLYRALAIGPASVAAPVAASAVVIPVLVGLLGGNPPSPIVVLGLAVTVGGVALVSFAGGEEADVLTAPIPGHGLPPERDAASASGARRVVPLSLLSALCFGSFFVLLDLGTAAAGGAGWAPLWVALGMYAGALPITVAVGAFSRRTGGLRLPPARLLAPVALVGLLAVGADISLTFALASGQIAVVSVLASLDPLVTVLLARIVLAEQLPRLQSAGVVMALAGVILVSAG